MSASGSGWGNVVNYLVGTAIDLGRNLKKTPMFVWIYLAVVIWLYKRMSRDFLGVGTRRKVLLGKKIDLTKEEEEIASGLVDPATISHTFDNVGGLSEAKDVLNEHVVWPFRNPELYKGSLCTSPSGVLFHGPPGTGKTLLARALAKELDSHFINVSVDKLFSKYVGESEKLAAAVFTLARKVQPCVIFVDEVDSLLSTRSSGESEVHTHTKTIFMTEWDGIATGTNVGDRILVVGATNRMNTLDEAVLRRLPIRLEVPTPDTEGRRHILSILLDEGEVVLDENFDLDYVAHRTNGYSGSDLKELCKAAALMPMRELMKKSRGKSGSGAAAEGEVTAPSPSETKSSSPRLIVTQQHFEEALKRVKPTPQAQHRLNSANGLNFNPMWGRGLA